jgi:alkylhydroperoxidase/carboxymuconolactone decarboxylase family protein YurZ
MSQLERIKEESTKLKEMLDSIFENDPTYKVHDEAAKEAAKIKGNTKKQLMRLSQAADLAGKIQSLKSQMKELNQTLSDYLQDYAKTTGQTSFETSDGQVRQIVYIAKLVKANIV